LGTAGRVSLRLVVEVGPGCSSASSLALVQPPTVSASSTTIADPTKCPAVRRRAPCMASG